MLNQDGRRICSRCGKALPHTEIRCPKCGTLNRVGNVFCDHCNARLIQPSQILPPDVPTPAEEAHESSSLKSIQLPSRAGSVEGSVPQAGELPDWLLDLGIADSGDDDANGETDEISGQGSYPDWLSNLFDEDAQLVEEDEELADNDLSLDLEPEQLPDWLIGDDVALTSPDAGSAVEEVPDWLAGIEGTEEMSAAVEPESLSAEIETMSFSDSFGWGLGEEEAPEADVIPAEEGAELLQADVPDWLSKARKFDEDEVVFDTAVGLEQEDEISDQASVESSLELPDWLAELGGVNAEREESLAAGNESALSGVDNTVGLPDWLLSLVPGEATAAPEPASVPAPASEPVAMPDWLSDIGAESSGVSSGVFTKHADTVENEVPESEGPDWLEHVVAEAAPPSLASGVPAFLGEEIQGEPGAFEEEATETPEWLQGLEFTAADALDSSFAPDVALGKADMPQWLQDLRPPEVAGESGMGGADTSVLVPADIPDWVQALRPEAGEQGKGTRDRGRWATLAEPEGPLVGLHGVLPGLALVDMTPESDNGRKDAIPEAVIQQAQFWQSLLEQPRSAERPVARKVRSSQASPVVRVIVFLAFALLSLFAFLLLPADLQFVQTMPRTLAPGAAELVTSLDRVQPGQRVIVAWECALPYADEMFQIAAPVLEHLDDRQAHLVFVSTIPEGTTMGMSLAQQVRYQSELSDGGYLLGNDNGIAAYLGASEADAVQHVVVLSSQSERFRWWVEQVALTGSQRGTGLSLSVAVTASVKPLVAPYLQTDAVQGWIAGYTGGLAYRQSRGEVLTDFHTRAWDVLMLGHWFVAALLLLGMLYSLIAGKKGVQ